MKVRIELRSPKDVVVKHQSLAYDAIRRKRTNKKVGERQDVVEWCKLNDCRGFKAVTSGLFPGTKDPHAQNRRLDNLVWNGEERALLLHPHTRGRKLSGPIYEE